MFLRARVKKSFFFCKDEGQPTFLHVMIPCGLEALKQQQQRRLPPPPVGRCDIFILPGANRYM